jgi:hypothetical protein
MKFAVESAQAIAQFFREQGYIEEGLNRIGLAEFPWSAPARRSALAWTVRAVGACAADLVLGVNSTTRLLNLSSMLRPGGKR